MILLCFFIGRFIIGKFEGHSYRNRFQINLLHRLNVFHKEASNGHFLPSDASLFTFVLNPHVDISKGKFFYMQLLLNVCHLWYSKHRCLVSSISKLLTSIVSYPFESASLLIFSLASITRLLILYFQAVVAIARLVF